MITFHSRFYYVCVLIYIYTYVCSHFVQVVAAVAQACCSYHRAPYCANAKGLPVSGYFKHYKWGIQHIQRWRPVNVNLMMIRTLNSWLLRVVPINSLERRAHAPATVDTDSLAVDLLRKKCTTRKTLFQSVLLGCRAFTHASPSPVNYAPALFTLLSPCSYLGLLNFSVTNVFAWLM